MQLKGARDCDDNHHRHSNRSNKTRSSTNNCYSPASLGVCV